MRHFVSCRVRCEECEEREESEIAAATSIPSAPGMSRSSTATSGRCRSIWTIASVPEAATATTSMSACRDRIASRASLIRVSSSAMTIRIAGAGESGDAGSSGYPGCSVKGVNELLLPSGRSPRVQAEPARWTGPAGAEPGQ